MTRLPTALLILAVAACGGGGTEPDLDASTTESIAAALGAGSTELALRYGEAVRINGSVLRIGFDRIIGDSRCPVDAVCVWMGDAAVEVGIAAGTGPTFPLVLHTALAPRSVVWNGVSVTLLELTPSPKASDPPRVEEYAIRLELRRAPR